MLAGERVNVTENRRALHTALRHTDRSMSGKSGDASAAAHQEFQKMVTICERLHAGELVGSTGKPIRTVVNLGIGGSDLGPRLACEALKESRHPAVSCRFLSSIDPSAVADATADLDPETTLFVVVSKSFTTVETLTNARWAREWLISTLPDLFRTLDPDVSRHFIAVTANRDAAVKFGVAPNAVLKMWDWVGGRFSLASPAGLSVMLATSEKAFTEMLAGMRSVDSHFAQTPSTQNLPILLGLIGLWNRNFWGVTSHAVIPYSQRLRLLPAYLQQLVMESNGKRTSLDGEVVDCDTSPVLWGLSGPDSQHSVHQMLLQGTSTVSVDFIVCAQSGDDIRSISDATQREELLAANCFAQSAALAFGSEPSKHPRKGYNAHGVLPGNRPSTVIIARRLTPSVLGQLIALYEHQVIVQGFMWGINSFDQPAVEHGKTLALRIGKDMRGDASASESSLDPATAALIERFRRVRRVIG